MPGMASMSADRPRSVPLPRIWGVNSTDVAALLLGNAVLIVAMWVRHGGLDQLHTLGGMLTAIGQLTALFGTYVALVQLVLMSRSPWLDEAFGMDRLAWWHRWLGFATVWLIAAHGLATLTGYALNDGASLIDETITILGTFPFVLWSVAGFALFVLVGVTSLRAARRRLSYETWFGLHLYAYLAIALASLHQLFTGADFIHDPIAAAYWIGLYVAAAALIVVFRFGQPAWTSWRHRLHVSAVVPEARGVVSIYLTGRDLDQLKVRSGQYFVFRFLVRDGWWRGHPFSLSAAPNGQWLRITVKSLGDDTERMPQLAVGTRVFVEGPYGVLTGARRTRRKVTLIAGGIGIAPIRALLESLPGGPGDLTLVYRASNPLDVVFRDELDQLAAYRGAAVHYVVGHRRGGHHTHASGDPMAPAALRSLVPDIARHDVYLCGPTGLMQAVERHLRELGVPRRHVHAERFAY
jgi:predicted ferric reductase